MHMAPRSHLPAVPYVALFVCACVYVSTSEYRVYIDIYMCPCVHVSTSEYGVYIDIYMCACLYVSTSEHRIYIYACHICLFVYSAILWGGYD